MYTQFFCPGVVVTKVFFDAREANRRRFTTRVISGLRGLENYATCNTFPSVATIPSVPCTGPRTYMSTSNLSVVFECEDPLGCSFFVDFIGSCTFWATDSVRYMSYAGLVLGALLVLFGLAMVVANFAARLYMRKLVVLMFALGVLMGGVTLAQWAVMLRVVDTDTAAWTQMLETSTIFLLCTATSYALLILIQFCLMYQWVYAHYRAERKADASVLKRVKVVFVVLTVVALLLLGASLAILLWPMQNGGFSANAAQDDNRTMAQIVVICIEQVAELVSAVVFLVYAGLLIKANVGAAKRATSSKLLLIMIVVIVVALTSLAFTIYLMVMKFSVLLVEFLLPSFLSADDVSVGLAALVFVYVMLPVPVLVILAVLASDAAEKRVEATALDETAPSTAYVPLLAEGDYKDKYDL